MSKAKSPAPPSADTLIRLEQLLVGPPTAASVAAAWRLITAAQANSDFFVVLDYALDKGFVVPLGGDPKREPTPTWTNPLDGSEMVWIPPGRCLLGSDKKPVEVDVAGFSLARYPVTNERFATFLEETGYPSHETVEANAADQGEYENGAFVSHWAGDDPPRNRLHHPVVFVSYHDAWAYCDWAGLSLPGEFQWEKAARGTDGRTFPWGNTSPGLGRRKFVHFNAGGTQAVSELPAARSPYGCEQMAGNVSTWCQPGDPKKPAQLPPARPVVGMPAAGKPVQAAVRGGAFKHSRPRTLQAYHRRQLSVIRRNDWVGIRPACFLPVRPAAAS